MLLLYERKEFLFSNIMYHLSRKKGTHIYLRLRAIHAFLACISFFLNAVTTPFNN